MRRFFVGQARRHLGERFTMKDFNPQYGPWDQRLCAVPDANLFSTIRKGRADVVTDGIDRFIASGIRLSSGKVLEADIIVTATGLNLQLFGGAQMNIDGTPVVIKDRVVYKGMMVDGVPNLLAIFGYTNASWTLKADIVSEHFVRMITHMDKKKLKTVTPRAKGIQRTNDTVMGSLASGYVRRGADNLPRQGDKAPWTVLNDYPRDAAALKLGSVTNKALDYAP